MIKVFYIRITSTIEFYAIFSVISNQRGSSSEVFIIASNLNTNTLHYRTSWSHIESLQILAKLDETSENEWIIKDFKFSFKEFIRFIITQENPDIKNYKVEIEELELTRIINLCLDHKNKNIIQKIYGASKNEALKTLIEISSRVSDDMPKQEFKKINI